MNITPLRINGIKRLPPDYATFRIELNDILSSSYVSPCHV